MSLDKLLNKSKTNYTVYTPLKVSREIVAKALSLYFKGNKKRKLESIRAVDLCCGNGNLLIVLLESLIRIHKIYHGKYDYKKKWIEGYDLDSKVLEELRNRAKEIFDKYGISGDINIFNEDSLMIPNSKSYNLIIGNPPYLGEKNNREIFEKIRLTEFGQKYYEGKMDYLYFFIEKGIELLKKDGVLALVLPSELLQVKFTEEIREYLKRQFQRIEIYTFNDLMFDCKGQDTIVLIAFKEHNEKGEFFTNIKLKEELENNSFTLKENNLLVDSNVKWTHHFLKSDELNFLDNLKQKLKSVDYYTDSKPGIVTAANNFFIINKEIEKKYNLSKYTRPIIQKGFFVNGSVVFDKKNIEELEQSNHPTRLLQLNDNDKISEKLSEYLSIGTEQKIQERYKCKIRNNWYVIPNISTIPDALFFKRCHNYPKLLKNTSSALVTDSAYKVNMKAKWDLNSFIFSFYNSLTLVFAETDGRYYGGGVLELTPREFKKLPIPYIQISANDFEKFTHDFENKENIEEILSKNDKIILKQVLNLNDEEIIKIKMIRKKLIDKRMKKK